MSQVKHYQTFFYKSEEAFIDYYVVFVQTHQADFDLIDAEYQNLRLIHDYLKRQVDQKSAQAIIIFIKALAAYLKKQSIHKDLLQYCQSGLLACELLQKNAGWLYLLQYEAHFALGDWENASVDAEAAVGVTSKVEPRTHAQALLALGRLQINRGDYRSSLETLTTAERSFLDMQDTESAALARAELAAYYMNKGELNKALDLYQEVDRLQKRNGSNNSSDHTLLMLGVVHRKMGDYQKSLEYLAALLNRGEEEGNNATIATASHHLAWAYLNMGNMHIARLMANHARQLYMEINDPRGGSDADEQLGMIALANNEFDQAINFLKESLRARRYIGNKHGAASSMRHLGTAYLHKGNFIAGARYLSQGLTTYHRLGILGHKRVTGMLKEFLNWTFFRKRWTI